jgi:hypothetical protein
MKTSFTRLERYLSASAVVLSLVFVGWETRQNTMAQRAHTRQALSDASRENTLALANDAELMRVFALYLDYAEDSLTAVETEQASIFLWTLIRNAENVFYQYQEGVIGRDALGTYGFVGAYFQRPSFPEHWARVRGWFDPEFASAFEAANGLETP